jgi:transcription-repair coupling factor (superfamily II helicase)
MLEETVRRLMSGDAAPKLVPADVTIDTPNYLPDDYVVSQEAKIDVYKRLARFQDAKDVEAVRTELRERFGPLPGPAEAMLALAQLRIIGGALGIEGVLVRGDEARITFRDSAVPRVKGLSAAFHDVQFQAEVRRAVPLSLKLTRLGGAPMLDGLVRALRGLVV